jgi:hypothetical protein
MKCTSCRARIPITHRPGVFLFIAALFGAGAVVSLISLPWPMTVAALLVVMWCVGGMLAEKTDAANDAADVEGGDGRDGAITCPMCGKRNPIRPWSV